MLGYIPNKGGRLSVGMDVLAWRFDNLLERYSFLSRCKQYRSFHGTIFSIFLAKSCTVAIVHTHGIGELEMHIFGYVQHIGLFEGSELDPGFKSPIPDEMNYKDYSRC